MHFAPALKGEAFDGGIFCQHYKTNPQIKQFTKTKLFAPALKGEAFHGGIFLSTSYNESTNQTNPQFKQFTKAKLL